MGRWIKHHDSVGDARACVGRSALLASQRVHFERNALSVQPLMAMFAAFGLISLHGWALRLAARRGWVTQRVGRRTRMLAFLVLAFITLPVWHFADLVRDRTDSRNLAQAWIDARIQPEWTIVVPAHLNFDTRKLEKAGRHVMVVDLKAARDTDGLNAVVAGVLGQPSSWCRTGAPTNATPARIWRTA